MQSLEFDVGPNQPTLETTLFQCQVPHSFDELLLGLYSPRGVDVFVHNGVFGYSTTGKLLESGGHCVKIYGPQGIDDWSTSLDIIMLKLDRSGCKRLASILW